MKKKYNNKTQIRITKVHAHPHLSAHTHLPTCIHLHAPTNTTPRSYHLPIPTHPLTHPLPFTHPPTRPLTHPHPPTHQHNHTQPQRREGARAAAASVTPQAPPSLPPPPGNKVSPASCKLHYSIKQISTFRMPFLKTNQASVFWVCVQITNTYLL